MRFTCGSSLVLVVLLGAAACGGFRSPDAVSRHIGEITGTGYARERGLTVGRTALRLSGVGLRASGVETPEVLDALRELRIGVYRARSASPALDRRLEAEDLPGYSPVVALQPSSGESVLLVSRSSFGRMREMLVIIDGVDQLVIVQVRGDLEEIVEDVVRLAFARAERPQLAAPTLESLADRERR